LGFTAFTVFGLVTFAFIFAFDFTALAAFVFAFEAGFDFFAAAFFCCLA